MKNSVEDYWRKPEEGRGGMFGGGALLTPFSTVVGLEKVRTRLAFLRMLENLNWN